MQLNELKLITASNLINLRTGAGMTQAELGALLNYSDKTISKWERAEAIPDAFVLKQIADLFHVTVDSLLASHDEWKPVPVETPETEQVSYSTRRIIAVVLVGIWTLALAVFVALWMVGILFWQAFVIALPVSFLVFMILALKFHLIHKGKLQFVIAGFVLSLFVAGYLLCYPRYNPWQVFLLLVPAEILVFLSCNLRIKTPKKLKIRKSTHRRDEKTDG